MMKTKLGKFGSDDTAPITRDGAEIGYVERVYGERFASASSRARVKFVDHYLVVPAKLDAEEFECADLSQVRARLIEVAS
jgi:hypothetical protein